MSRQTTAQRNEAARKALADSHALGFAEGMASGRRVAESAAPARKELIQLISVVGQAIQANSDLLKALAHTIDNSGVRL